MIRHPLKIIRASLPVLLLGLYACADYRFTVNDTTVYTPATLFTDYEISNANLRECVSQHIRDQSVTAAAQLKELNCSHAGIDSLAGISTFRGIERLKLTNNAFTDLAPLAQLTRLEQLLLDDNPLTELGPVAGLPRLKLLSLEGNTQLRCSELEPSLLSPLLEVIPPEHCTQKQAED